MKFPWAGRGERKYNENKNCSWKENIEAQQMKKKLFLQFFFQKYKNKTIQNSKVIYRKKEKWIENWIIAIHNKKDSSQYKKERTSQTRVATKVCDASFPLIETRIPFPRGLLTSLSLKARRSKDRR